MKKGIFIFRRDLRLVDNIGLIKEFSYRPKRTRKKYLMSIPKKQFQKEIDKRVKK